MELNDLHPDLRRAYLPTLSSGIQKIDHTKFQNMWFVVPPAPPSFLPENLPAKIICQATETMAQQPQLEEANDLDRLVSYLFLRREAVESSRMEGTMSTIEHVLSPGELFDEWKAKSEGAAVRGYAHALETELKNVVFQGLRIFESDLLARLHTETMRFDPRFQGVPGKPREPGQAGEIVWIRGHTHRPEDSIYNPPPAHQVKRCLQETMRWFADEDLVERGNAGMALPLVVRIAIGHAHFEAIHPFTDGNGRVGRMLITLQMACQKKLPLYLAGFIEEEKQNYYKVLQTAQKKLDYGPIVEFFSVAILASHRESLISRQKIESLPFLWQVRGKFRKESTSERALKWMITHPIFMVKTLQAHFNVSAQAANTAAELLVKAKVVRERTGLERNRVFAAEEVISLLSRRFGSDPDVALEGAKSLLGLLPPP